MNTRNRFFLFQGISIIFLLGLSSCQKDGLTPVATSGGVAKANLTVGLPPVLMAWTGVASIPYNDGVPGDVPGSNQYPLGFAINGKGFVLGSILTTTKYQVGDYVNDLWQWDPATRTWTKKTSIPLTGGTLVQGTAFVIGDNAYVVADNQTWQYNQPTDTWTKKATLPGVPRSSASSFAINGKGYLGLGTNDNTVVDLNDWWQYDPTADRWTQKGNFAGNSRDGAAAFAVDGEGYVVSGFHGTGNGGEYGRTVWQYDPVADHWTQKASFPGTARVHAVAANGTVGGVDVGFVVGGNLSTDGPGDSWSYDPAHDTWASLPMGGGGLHWEAAGFVIGHSLYVANVTVSVLVWSR